MALQVARRVKMQLEAKLLGSADADPIRFSVPGYRARLYELRFGATPGGQHMCLQQLLLWLHISKRRHLIGYLRTPCCASLQKGKFGESRWFDGPCFCGRAGEATTGRLVSQASIQGPAWPLTYSLVHLHHGYGVRFIGEGVEKAARRVSQAFIQGLAWSLAYYTRGSALPSLIAPKGEGFSTGASWAWCALDPCPVRNLESKRVHQHACKPLPTGQLSTVLAAELEQSS